MLNDLFWKLIGKINWEIPVTAIISVIGTLFLTTKANRVKKRKYKELEPARQVMREFIENWYIYNKEGNSYSNEFVNFQWPLIKDLTYDEKIGIITALVATGIFRVISFRGKIGEDWFYVEGNEIIGIKFYFNASIISLRKHEAISLSEERKNYFIRLVNEGKYDSYLSGKLKPLIGK